MATAVSNGTQRCWARLSLGIAVAVAATTLAIHFRTGATPRAGCSVRACSSLATRARAKPWTDRTRLQNWKSPSLSSLSSRRTASSFPSSVDRSLLAHSVGVPEGCVSAIILAGGVGKRMGAEIPKQYLDLSGKPIATYSLETFAGMKEVGELVVVCLEEWEHIFRDSYEGLPDGHKKPIVWARPGKERQDSVLNGLLASSKKSKLVAIHDSARPLITPEDALNCMRDGLDCGAAVLGVPVKPTIKEVNDDGTVHKTLERSRLWEVQTPQCVKPSLLEEGFDFVKKGGIEVTDDVSIVEAIGRPVRITKGSYTNIKVLNNSISSFKRITPCSTGKSVMCSSSINPMRTIDFMENLKYIQVTTPDDMSVAQRFLNDQNQG